MVLPGQTQQVHLPADKETGKSTSEKSDSKPCLADQLGFFAFNFFIWVFAIVFFFYFFPTIETVDVIIVHNKMELKELIWNYCKLFNLWQMINLSKLSAVSNFKLNFYIYIFADICAVSKGYSSAWGTEEFLSTRCWNTVELFINLYWFRKYCGTKSFAVFTEICFSGVLWKDIPMHWHKSFNLQTCFLWKGQNFAASICFISCFLF